MKKRNQKSNSKIDLKVLGIILIALFAVSLYVYTSYVYNGSFSGKSIIYSTSSGGLEEIKDVPSLGISCGGYTNKGNCEGVDSNGDGYKDCVWKEALLKKDKIRIGSDRCIVDLGSLSLLQAGVSIYDYQLYASSDTIFCSNPSQKLGMDIYDGSNNVNFFRQDGSSGSFNSLCWDQTTLMQFTCMKYIPQGKVNNYGQGIISQYNKAQAGEFTVAFTYTCPNGCNSASNACNPPGRCTPTYTFASECTNQGVNSCTGQIETVRDSEGWSCNNNVGTCISETCVNKWTSIGSPGGGTYALEYFNEKLYSISGTGGDVYRYDGGTSWTEVSIKILWWNGASLQTRTTFPNGVYDLLVYNNKLYASGFGGVYEYDGVDTWRTLKSIDATTLVNYNGKLYTGTSVFSEPDNQLVRYDGGYDGNAVWTSVGNVNLVGGKRIKPFGVYNNLIFVGLDMPTNTYIGYVYVYDGVNLVLGGEATNPPSNDPDVTDMAVSNNIPYFSIGDGVYKYEGGSLIRTEVWSSCMREIEEFNGLIYAPHSCYKKIYRYIVGEEWADLGPVDSGSGYIYTMFAEGNNLYIGLGTNVYISNTSRI